MTCVRVEAMAWVAEALGSGKEHLVLEEEIAPGETVRDLLNRFAARHEGFKLVYDSQREGLTDLVTIVLNERLLELMNGLDSVLNDGDVLMLLGAYEGG